MPSWLTCINSLCMVYSETHTHTLAYTFAVPYDSAVYLLTPHCHFTQHSRVDCTSVRVGACIHLYPPMVGLIHLCRVERSEEKEN